MNGRQFKKLCKKSAEVMIRLNHRYSNVLFFSECRDEYPEIARRYKWDRDTIKQNWRGKGIEPDFLPVGIAGFGCMDGYYEQEWSDNDALSELMLNLFDHFTRWSECENSVMPENSCPEKLRRLPGKAIKYTELNLINSAKSI